MGNKMNTVKHIRTTFGIKQKELICQGISRPYLSNLENEKVELSHEMAYRISEKFNEVFAEKNRGIRFDKEDLMNEHRLLMKLEINKELERLENVENVDLDTVQNLQNKFLVVESSFEYARLNSTIGSYYHYKEDELMALLYLIKAFDMYFSKGMYEEGLTLLSKIIYNCIEVGSYEIASAYDKFFFEDMKTQHDIVSGALMSSFCYNSAILHKQLGNFEKAIDRLDRIDANESSEGLYKEFSKVLRADMFVFKGENVQALELLNDLLNATEDRTVRVYALMTKLELLSKMEEVSEFVKLGDQLLSLLKDQSESLEMQVGYMLSTLQIAIEEKQYEFVMKHVIDSIDACRKLGDREYYESFIQVIDRLEKSKQASKLIETADFDLGQYKADLMHAYFGM